MSTSPVSFFLKNHNATASPTAIGIKYTISGIIGIGNGILLMCGSVA
jgi:hypothetical protein